ncbi:MAG: hypothetical protein AB6733_20640 [Clostridiaceae bacterium]
MLLGMTAAGGAYLASLFAINGAMAVAAAGVVINKGIDAVCAPITISYGYMRYSNGLVYLPLAIPYAEAS